MNLAAPIESLVPGLRGRVLTALVRSSRPIALRELARRIGTSSHSSVKRVLQELSEEGMVRYALVSKGSQFFELNQDHLLVRHLVAMDRSKEAVLDQIRSHVARWPVEPCAVVLFGSVARGEATSTSDIDVLVVWGRDQDPSDDCSALRLDLVESVYARTGNSLNLVALSAADWDAALQSGEALVGEVARDGVSVMGETVRALVSGRAGLEA